ncbi:Dihydrodipicolinate synthase/N-acetylneuraminate lyase [Kaistia soli DSM 19436]|uniref:Dihydrodipicolinate synthase/N-acetylneuraminate lyase n=1 Tax=Kaistia soli DSM 19436 TaxID=1122133 RepID=A0A1M5NGN2_9HYPH|nr:dihydrodipicolinate synthase family protein [Kaistia soli]SHG88678.1 Dihydrodipicolinate synthase/N-acetylneuraminate lyase [Kaistia soli DSM 19436]
MKTDPVEPADLARSVISVPPLPRLASGSLSADETARLIDWLVAGGVSTFLFGGNANLYNMGVREFGALLDLLEYVTPDDGWTIPSIGADYGKASDQLDALRERDFPTAMLLPASAATTPAGVATGLRRLADRYGRPLVAYVRNEGYLAPRDLAALFEDGAICALKYAIVHTNPAVDATLSAMLDAVGSAERIVSGIGERPVIAHLGEFGLAGFTSGSVCIAPHLSTAILHALKGGDSHAAAELRAHFLPLEDLRDAYSPIRVLHEAVRLAEIAETGPLAPFLANIDDASTLAEIETASKRLRAVSKRHSG